MRTSLLAIVQAIAVHAKTLDNRLIDSPNVTCGPEVIRIRGESEDVFEGQIFIKNQRRSSECFVVYSAEENSTSPEFSLPLKRLSSCGIEIQRNPIRGLELFVVFVFAFHPSFVTAGDRAFAVHCLFQQEQITVSTRFDFISDIVPKPLRGVSSSLPNVEFTIVQGRVPAQADEVSLASVGQPLMLVWAIEKASPIYGLQLLDCSAETRERRGMNIIKHGCTIDSTLISDVRYSENFQRAYADATAFKFPDMSEVWFRCLVKLCIRRFEHLLLTGKSEDHLCGNAPKCSLNQDRHRRDTSESNHWYDDNVITVTGRLSVNDDPVIYNYAAQVASSEPSTVCLSKDLLALGSAVSITVCFSTLLTLASLIYSKTKATPTLAQEN